jgi:hypothetical protein
MFGQQTTQASGKLPRERQQLGTHLTAGFKSEGTRSRQADYFLFFLLLLLLLVNNLLASRSVDRC